MDHSMTTTTFTLDGFRVGVRHDATEIMQSVTEVLGYGAAVVVEPIPR